MQHRPRRRLLLVLLGVTLVVLMLDLVHAPGTSAVRTAGASVLGPLELLTRPGQDERLARVTAERDQLAAQLREARTATRTGLGVAHLLASPSTAGARVVPARVLAVGTQGAAGPERVTIDVGSRDGIRADLSVVTANGMAGKVVSVAPWTSDVLLIGSKDLAVGVRVGTAGALGSVSGSGATGAVPRAAGLLSLRLVQATTITAGDAVSTLGSVGNRPFVPGETVGTVVSVDPQHGRLAATATVRPAVDPTTLDVVGVLLSAPRSELRPSTTGGTP